MTTTSKNSQSIPSTSSVQVIYGDIKVPRPFSGSTKSASQLNTFLLALEVQFVTKNITDDYRKICFLASNLVDDALTWFFTYSSTHPIQQQSYSSFTTALQQAFAGKLDSYDILMKLSNCTQRTNVDGYIKEFMTYRNLLPNTSFSEDMLINFFIKGLQPSLRQIVRVQPNITSLYQATETAKKAAHSLTNDGGPLFSPATSTPRTFDATPQYPVDADGDVIMSIRRPRRNNYSRRPSNNYSTNRHHSSNRKPSQSSDYYRKLFYDTCKANQLCFHCGRPDHTSSKCPNASNP